jgi:hypothetical protein
MEMQMENAKPVWIIDEVLFDDNSQAFYHELEIFTASLQLFSTTTLRQVCNFFPRRLYGKFATFFHDTQRLLTACLGFPIKMKYMSNN